MIGSNALKLLLSNYKALSRGAGNEKNALILFCSWPTLGFYYLLACLLLVLLIIINFRMVANRVNLPTEKVPREPWLPNIFWAKFLWCNIVGKNLENFLLKSVFYSQQQKKNGAALQFFLPFRTSRKKGVNWWRHGKKGGLFLAVTSFILYP